MLSPGCALPAATESCAGELSVSPEMSTLYSANGTIEDVVGRNASTGSGDTAIAVFCGNDPAGTLRVASPPVTVTASLPPISPRTDSRPDTMSICTFPEEKVAGVKVCEGVTGNVAAAAAPDGAAY